MKIEYWNTSHIKSETIGVVQTGEEKELGRPY